MRQKETTGARLYREGLGVSLEIGFAVLIMAIGFVIALIFTRGRF